LSPITFNWVQPVTPGSPLNAEVTPEKGRPAVVMPVMPSTQEKQVRAGALAQQWLPARHPGEVQQAKQAAGDSDNQEMAELKRRNQAMEDALRCVISTDESTGMMEKFMQSKGHSEVVGIITAGGAMPSVTK
jgi:hypothetical protein